MRPLLVLLTLLTFGSAARAQTSSGGYVPQSDIPSVVQALMPAPAVAVPLSELVAGSVGSSTNYMRADARLPRITRTTTATTITGGTFSVTWATALAASPAVILTPIATGSAAVTCELTAAPTTTTVAGRCWTAQNTLLNLSIVTAGLTVAPSANSAAGVQVQVIAIPPTQ